MVDAGASARIDELFEPFAAQSSPGATAAIVRNGNVDHVASYGMASIEHAAPNSRDTVFYIASTSKQFVAASIAILEAEGKVGLDDDIRTWLPEMHAFDPPIRVHHLVHHTSGLRDKYALAAVGDLPDDSFSTDRGSLQLLAAQRTLAFPSGSQMDYTNSGYFLLSQIVERASGMPLQTFTAERIFEPLGMTKTCFRPDTNVVIPRRASGYTQQDGEWRLAEYTLSSLGPGGVVTTVDDLARWDASFDQGSLQPSDLHSRMLRTRPLDDGSPNNYAFGLMVGEWRGLETVSHGGGVAGFSAEFLRFPTEGLTVICLANSPAVAASLKARQIAETVLGDRLEPAAESAADSPSEALETWEGVYVAETDALFARIRAADGGQVLDVAGQQIPLRSVGALRAAAGPLMLERDEHGAVTATQSGTTIARLVRLDEGDALRPEQLCGDYHSDELGSSVSVRLNEAGDLVFDRPRSGSFRLEHGAGEVYIAISDVMGSELPLVVRALPGSDGQVAALRISTSRAPGNIFERQR